MTLFIGCSFGDEFFDWLATSIPATLLDNVELEAGFLMDCPGGGRLLERLGSGLRDLAIDARLIGEYDDEEGSSLKLLLPRDWMR